MSKKLADARSAQFKARVAKLSAEALPEGVTPLNADFFLAQRLRGNNGVKLHDDLKTKVQSGR